MEKGVVGKLAGIKRVSETAGGYEQKNKESEEESDLPRRWRRVERRGRTAHGERRRWVVIER